MDERYGQVTCDVARDVHGGLLLHAVHFRKLFTRVTFASHVACLHLEALFSFEVDNTRKIFKV